MRLKNSFYLQPTLKVARALLGQFLVRRVRGKTLIGKIVETEAYVGFRDKASHASRGQTLRNAPMFDRGGRAYIYLIYGMYNCFNVTTEKKGYPAAVLIRALEPVQGIETMKKLRQTFKLENLCSGPGKLCTALNITRALNNESLVKSKKLWLKSNPRKIKSSEIKKAPRIGVDYAGDYRHKPWRYYLKNNTFVSKH